MEYKMNFEYYNYNNKIPLSKAKEMLEILIPFYNDLNNQDNSNKEMCDSWINAIRNTKDFAIILLYFNDILVGFINYMYQKRCLMISEIQIRKEYQTKYNIFKTLLKEMINQSDINRYNCLLATINYKNKKSIDIFTHIGFKNIKDNLYKINILELEKWLNK